MTCAAECHTVSLCVGVLIKRLKVTLEKQVFSLNERKSCSEPVWSFANAIMEMLQKSDKHSVWVSNNTEVVFTFFPAFMSLTQNVAGK